MSLPQIPIVNLASFYKPSTDGDIEDTIAVELFEALSNIGFVYLQNHNIPAKQLDTVLEISRCFFHLPTEIKQKYERGPESLYGWIAPEVERLDQSSKYPDLKETFNAHIKMDQQYWPNDTVENVQNILLEFMESCDKLSEDILRWIAIGLKMEDPEYFVKCHGSCKESGTVLRSLWYPKVVEATEKPGQIRCGEHSDYGSITLLFQDLTGGLQVKHRNGNYIEASPIPGTVLVNIGDMMQRWTADKLVSTRHRVLMQNQETRKQERQSLAYFVIPADDCIIKSIDKTDKYSPITCKEYISGKFYGSIE